VKNFKSVADSNNYGDDVTASYLLYPPNSHSLGVEADDFTVERQKEDVLGIFSSLPGATPSLLEEAWSVATARRGEIACSGMSLLEFRAAFNEVLG